MVKTIQIDESKCNGCGLCITACHEGALELIDGKAKLVRPNFCDGMGDCLPACPQNAISFVEDRNTPQPIVLGSNISTPGVQWPIQLALVSPQSAFLKGKLVIAADCTAFKVDSFRKEFVKDDPIVIGCPKLDDRSRFDKLIDIFRNNPISEVEVVRMEVPCCSALTRLVRSAIEMSGKDITINESVIGRDGSIL